MIEELTPLLRGWVNYFRPSDVKTAFEELDGWIRRKLCCIEWQQWKRPQTRAKKLIERRIDKVRVFTSTYNGRGAWWNAGASHMNAAFPSKWFAQQGTYEPPYRVSTLSKTITNRRMPNGTYGAVRGRGRKAPAYSILKTTSFYCYF